MAINTFEMYLNDDLTSEEILAEGQSHLDYLVAEAGNPKVTRFGYRRSSDVGDMTKYEFHWETDVPGEVEPI